jgi:hypothetical protein
MAKNHLSVLSRIFLFCVVAPGFVVLKTYDLLSIPRLPDRVFNASMLIIAISLMAGLAKGICETLRENGAEKVTFKLVCWITALFRLILPPKVRTQTFEPAYNDKKAVYLESWRKRQKWGRFFLAFCFVLSVLVMVAQSLIVATFDWLRRTMFPQFPRL